VGRNSFSFGVFLSLLLILGASAVVLRASPVHYLSDTNLAIFVLAPPPAENSPEQQADMAEVRLAHTNTIEWTTNVAAAERRISAFTFAPEIGPFFETNRLPVTAEFFRRVSQDTDKAVAAAKLYWNRPRPYIVDTNLFDGEEEIFEGSYPSGHSTLATVLALLLADLFPERREAILSRAEQIGWHRMLMAKHYPSDIYAGRLLGRRIVQELKRNRRFRQDFRKVRLEIQSSMFSF
jgi:acid phosphatase (class A)